MSAAETDVAMLDTLDPIARELAVTSMLDQARQWLLRAKESTVSAQDVAEFKAFVATVAEAAKQKKLSEDIQLDAMEMVRRSERALGVAIREGQAAGEIAKSGDIGGIAPGARSRSGGDLARPTQFAPKDELSSAYAMADNVTDAQFETALDTAKEEGNLSRANVVRKVAEIGSYREQQSDKWSTIAELASQGYTSPQIAKTVSMTEEGLRSGARKKGITFPADKLATGRIDPLYVIEQIVLGLEVSQSSLDVVSFEGVTPQQAADWLSRLTDPLRAIKRMQTVLKGVI
jgi:hypothetical protein